MGRGGTYECLVVVKVIDIRKVLVKNGQNEFKYSSNKPREL